MEELKITEEMASTAREKIMCLMLNNPYEYTRAIVILAANAIGWDNGIKPMDDTDMSLKLSTWIGIVAAYERENPKD